MQDAHAGAALVVGIDYRDGAAPPLRGAVNDARAIARLLVERFGFRPERIHRLLDGDATRAAIEAGLRDLARRATPGAPAVFYFAGHGTRMPAPHLAGEPDLFDEALVPADRPPPGAPTRDIRDDTLRRWLEPIRRTGAALTVILDCCHSGSATRGPSAVARRAAPPHDGPLPPGASPEAPTPAAARGPLVVLAAAADHQPAAETRDDPPHGLMTRTLLDLLDGPDPGDDPGSRPTWAELHDRLRAAIRRTEARQTPQLEGDGVDRTLFGAARRPLIGHRLATDRDGWRLDAGFLVGLKPGDRLDAVPLGRATPSGAIRVIEAGPCVSRVIPIHGAVPDPCRARRPGDAAPFTLRLHLPDGPPALAGLDWIEPAAPDAADLRLTPTATGWQLAGPHVVTTAVAGGPAALIHRLRRWSAWFGLHRLAGGRCPVDVHLRRRGDDRPRDDATPLILAPGDIYIVKARHRGPRPMHLALLELIDDGAIAHHPWAGSSAPGWQSAAEQPVDPGHTVFFAARARLSPGRRADRCTFVALATDAPTRFDALVQGAVRSGPAPWPAVLLRMGRRRGDLRGASDRDRPWGVGRAVCETRAR